MFLGGWLEKNNLAFGVAYEILADVHWSASSGFTKSYVSISHPSRNLQWLKCGKPSVFGAGEQVPDDGSLANIVADDESSSASFAHIIH